MLALYVVVKSEVVGSAPGYKLTTLLTGFNIEHGGQIDRIFAQWVIVCFEQLHENYRFGLLYSDVKLMH
jgi:hypothetical protein